MVTVSPRWAGEPISLQATDPNPEGAPDVPAKFKIPPRIWLIFLQYSKTALLITSGCAMEASGDHLINSRKHAEDADVIRTIATRILESTADLLAQLWSTFDIVDRCIT